MFLHKNSIENCVQTWNLQLYKYKIFPVFSLFFIFWRLSKHYGESIWIIVINVYIYLKEERIIFSIRDIMHVLRNSAVGMSKGPTWLFYGSRCNILEIYWCYFTNRFTVCFKRNHFKSNQTIIIVVLLFDKAGLKVFFQKRVIQMLWSPHVLLVDH